MKNPLAIFVLAIALVGCAPATLEGVRKMGPDRSYAFTAAQNYQQVYRTVLDQARKCYQTGMITAQMVVQGDLYHDIKSGTISVALHGGLGVDTYQVIDISETGENETKIVGHYSLGSVQSYGSLLESWVLAGNKECQV